MVDVTMPQLGETVAEGTITRWMKSVGDHVDVDEVLFEVSTDKVDSEVPSPVAGVLTEVCVEAGQIAEVGAVLAVIEAGEGGAGEGARSEASASSREEPEPAATSEAQEPNVQEPKATGASTRLRESGEQTSVVLSPIVRKMLSEAGVSADEVDGTGEGGRVTRADVEAYLANGASRPTSTERVSLSTAPAPISRAGAGDTVIPFNKIRQKTAEHMLMSKATSAHTLVTTEVDYANVDTVRLAKKDAFKSEEGISLTYMPFIARALVDAIREFPNVNASVGDNELIVHRDINIAIAVDINFEGLLVPVIQGTDGLRLRQIARQIADLATRARKKKLQASEIQNGTFTITNAGSFGTFITYPVINQPQVAILSTDGVKKRPVVVELPEGSDAIVVHPVGQLGLAWDHRAFDGAYAAAFLARLRDILQTRDWSAELS